MMPADETVSSSLEMAGTAAGQPGEDETATPEVAIVAAQQPREGDRGA